MRQIRVALISLTAAWPAAAQVAPARPPAEPVVAQSPQEFAHRIDSTLAALSTTGWFSGSVLVTRNGSPLFSHAYGMANRGRNAPNTMETRFNIGSMNKMMTAVAIAQLAQAGKLSLNAPVGRYLTDYPQKDVREKITIAQLLTHTSGMGSYWNANFERDHMRINGVKDYLALFADESLLFAPGERFEYSNEGFIVLGAIVEKVSGMSYYDYVRQRILEPAGMASTDFAAVADSSPAHAIGYVLPEDGGGPQQTPDVSHPAPPMTPNWESLPNRGGPAGGGFTTAGDLARFGTALQSGVLLPAEWRDSLWTVRTPMTGAPPDWSYGYGFILRPSPLGRQVGHTGGAPGIASSFDLYPETGYSVAVLTNEDGPGLRLALRKIAAGLQGMQLAEKASR